MTAVLMHMITFLINMAGFTAMTILLAYVLKERILSVIPIMISGLALILFVLCLIRHLSWIDYFFILTTAAIIVVGCCFRKKIEWSRIKDIVFDPGNIVIAGIFLFIFIIAWNRLAADSDELGVWALEVKTMFYVDGLTLPDMHTSINFSNYIPGQMLVEWWFCHLTPRIFNDGLMYFGYYAIYYFILAPLFVCGGTRNRWRDFVGGLVMIPILFALPSIFSIHEYSMLSVELLTGAVFLALIYSLFDVRQYTKAYTGIRWIALSIFLVLLKSDAILFLLTAYLTAIVLIHMDRKNVMSEQNEGDTVLLRIREHLNYKILALGLSLSAAVILVWQVAVRYYNRQGSFTTHEILDKFGGILSNIGPGKGGLEGDQMQYMLSLRETVLHQPLHWTTTNFYDLTVVSCAILLALVLYLIYRNQGFRNGKQEYITVTCIAVISIALFTLMLLFMYMYIFRESQYFDPTIMIKSLSRYMEPLLFGWSLTGLLVCLNSKNKKLGMAVLFLFLMCPSYTCLYNYFHDLRLNRENVRATYWQGREDFSEFFRESDDFFGADGQGRILFVYGGKAASLYDKQLRYLAAPRSILWLDCDDTDNFQETIYDTAVEGVCGFIWFEQVPEDIIQNFINEYSVKPLGDYLYEIL